MEFALSLGYPHGTLDNIPGISVESFSGVSNVAVFAALSAGERVLDLGCGSGLDSLIAARRVGATGKVVGVDFSEEMLDRAKSSLRELGCGNVMFLQSAAEQLPFREACIDRALVNGIFNLNPFRGSIFTELARVLTPGGAVFGAELVLQVPLEQSDRVGAANWFS